MNAPAAPPSARASKRTKKPAALPFPGLVAVTRNGVVAVYRSAASTRREVELTGLLVATRRPRAGGTGTVWAWVTYQGDHQRVPTAEERARLAATPEAPPRRGDRGRTLEAGAARGRGHHLVLAHPHAALGPARRDDVDEGAGRDADGGPLRGDGRARAPGRGEGRRRGPRGGAR